jgi:NAD(P)-dependent dehydrogenase (short-subunit alcohol dehydrogenase family)
MKSIVITGSTQGIGYGLAKQFLEQGCSVVISGRTEEKVQLAVEKLSKQYGRDRVYGYACDVREYEQVLALWESSRQVYSKIDIWINNAGISNSLGKFWDQPEERIAAVIETNVIGTMYGAKVALRGMQAQGFGALYNMMGFGSDGRKQAGMMLYGSSKAGLRYFTDALMEEVKDSNVIVGAISPGMVVTELVTASRETSPKTWENVKRAVNLIGDRVETITPWITKRILENKKNGAEIKWLTMGKLLWRVLSAPVIKRKVVNGDR